MKLMASLPMEWLRRALTTDLVVPGTTFGARTVVVAILFTIFVSLMVAFFLLTFNHSGARSKLKHYTAHPET